MKTLRRGPRHGPGTMEMLDGQVETIDGMAKRDVARPVQATNGEPTEIREAFPRETFIIHVSPRYDFCDS